MLASTHGHALILNLCNCPVLCFLQAMRSCILLLVLAAGAVISTPKLCAAANGTAQNMAHGQRSARCILKMKGDSQGSLAINFTCSGPVVKAYIRQDEYGPSVLATSGVKVLEEPGADCLPDDPAYSCIIALCSSEPPVVIDQGSQLLSTGSEYAKLCISGNATVSIRGMMVADNGAPGSPRSRPGRWIAAVRVAGNSRAAVSGCQFLNNHYALFVDSTGASCNVTITDSTFAGNYALRESYGGGAAIYAEAAGAVDISNSTFSNNFATGVASGGGAIYTALNMTFHTVSFVENYVIGAMAGGGAIWVDTLVGILVQNSSFTGNWVEGDASEGGAIYGRKNSAISMVGGSLERNRAVGERARGELVVCSSALLAGVGFAAWHTHNDGLLQHTNPAASPAAAAALLTLQLLHVGNLAACWQSSSM